jgi:2-methylcitrate dehydratase PrpD
MLLRRRTATATAAVAALLRLDVDRWSSVLDRALFTRQSIWRYPSPRMTAAAAAAAEGAMHKR